MADQYHTYTSLAGDTQSTSDARNWCSIAKRCLIRFIGELVYLQIRLPGVCQSDCARATVPERVCQSDCARATVPERCALALRSVCSVICPCLPEHSLHVQRACFSSHKARSRCAVLTFCCVYGLLRSLLHGVHLGLSAVRSKKRFDRPLLSYEWVGPRDPNAAHSQCAQSQQHTGALS